MSAQCQNAMRAAPIIASSVGYNIETFDIDANFSPTTVDSNITYKPGYKWYYSNFFSKPPFRNGAAINSDGSITLTLSNGTIASVGQIHGAPTFVGEAFGGGGYFEAELRFDPALLSTGKGWPSWWTMSLEHMVGLPGEEWAEQSAGYDHFVEADIFEYMPPGNQVNKYFATLHDWHGIFRKTCGAAIPYCDSRTSFSASQRFPPGDIDWRAYHRYGMLWLPAHNNQNGYIKFYFDGKQVGQTAEFPAFSPKSVSFSPLSPWPFGVIDRQHLVLILGSGSAPMQVRSVHVWQKSNAGNLTN